MKIKRFVWWLSLTAFMFSAAWIAIYLYQAYSGMQSIGRRSSEIAQQRQIAASFAPRAAEESAQSGDDLAGDEMEAGAEPTAAPVDPVLSAYAKLAEENPDMAGWVYIEGTAVDYPVMHTPEEPEKYLHRDFEGRYAFAGLPFLDAASDPKSTTGNLIVYAHNMRSGQMFAQIRNYVDPDFRAAHSLISFDTLDRREVYEVVAVLRLEAIGRQEPSMRCYRPIDTTDGEAVRQLNEYLDRFASVRVGDFEPGDSILTLSTCERLSSTDRLVVMARSAASPSPPK